LSRKKKGKFFATKKKGNPYHTFSESFFLGILGILDEIRTLRIPSGKKNSKNDYFFSSFAIPSFSQGIPNVCTSVLYSERRRGGEKERRREGGENLP